MSEAISVQALGDLDQLDVDGAIRETDAAIEGDSRADFFRKAAIGGGAVLGSGVLLGGIPELAAAGKPSKKQDVRILNFALTLEYLESEFYKEAVSRGSLNGDVLSAARLVRDHENAHVRFLKKALGKSAVKKPRFDFGNSTGDQATFLKTALALEETGVKAYLGQVARIKQGAVLKAAGTIATVEARHAARFRTLNGQSFAPNAFDKAATAGQTLRTVKKTGFIKS